MPALSTFSSADLLKKLGTSGEFENSRVVGEFLVIAH
jgi:hypothetical protein